MYRANRRRRRISPLKVAIVVLLVAFVILVTERLIVTFAKSYNQKKISQDVKKNTTDNKKTDNKKNDAENKTNEVENAKVQKEEVKPVIKPTDYMEGSSHNYEATAWAYSAKDVTMWINQPSTYTGQDKIVFLTFDDGPSEVYTNTVLDVLKKYNAHATFFIVGNAADRDVAKPILERQMKEGHAIGYHSYSHSYSHLYPGRTGNKANILGEIEQNRLALTKSLGDNFKSTIFRYPGGHMSWNGLADTDVALAQMGIYHIDWNVLSGDAEAKGSARYSLSALDNIKQDMQMYNPKIAVVLMHDIHAKSVNDLEQIILYYQSLGYKFGILT